MPLPIIPAASANHSCCHCKSCPEAIGQHFSGRCQACPLPRPRMHTVSVACARCHVPRIPAAIAEHVPCHCQACIVPLPSTCGCHCRAFRALPNSPTLVPRNSTCQPGNIIGASMASQWHQWGIVGATLAIATVTLYGGPTLLRAFRHLSGKPSQNAGSQKQPFRADMYVELDLLYRHQVFSMIPHCFSGCVCFVAWGQSG